MSTPLHPGKFALALNAARKEAGLDLAVFDETRHPRGPGGKWIQHLGEAKNHLENAMAQHGFMEQKRDSGGNALPHIGQKFQSLGKAQESLRLAKRGVPKDHPAATHIRAAHSAAGWGDRGAIQDALGNTNKALEATHSPRDASRMYAMYNMKHDKALVSVGPQNRDLPGVKPAGDHLNQQVYLAEFGSRDEARSFMERYFGKEAAGREHRRAMNNRAAGIRKDKQRAEQAHNGQPRTSRDQRTAGKEKDVQKVADTQADKALPDVAAYLDQHISGGGDEPYAEDEATEYGNTPEEKAAGVGVDTGAFHEDLATDHPVDSVDYGQNAPGGVKVGFKDGSIIHYDPNGRHEIEQPA